MNRIIKVNVANRSFDMDEKAYAILTRYNNDLANLVRNEPKASEISKRVEVEFAKNFENYIIAGNNFITESCINNIIAEKGSPSDFFKKDTLAQPVHQWKEQDSEKRLYRNPNDRLIAGICGGIGAYIGVDSKLVRLIFALLIVFGGLSFWLYIIFWIFIPKATTKEQIEKMTSDEQNLTDLMEQFSHFLKKMVDAIVKPWQNSENK